jgi:hypothetical protein
MKMMAIDDCRVGWENGVVSVIAVFLMLSKYEQFLAGCRIQPVKKESKS